MLVRKLEAAMSESPDARWTSPKNLPNPPEQQRGPATPRQRRIGIRVGIGLILVALLVIILLDHYGILH
jgi:hypothetical protein